MRRGKLVGQLDLGGGFGFRPSRRGLLGWFRRDIRIPRQWMLCHRCGLVWAFVDVSRLPSDAVNGERAESASEDDAADISPQSLVWNVSCFEPRPVQRLRRIFRCAVRMTAFVIIGAPTIILFAQFNPWIAVEGIFWSSLMVLALIALWCWPLWAYLRLCVLVKRHGFQLCPSCEYNLSGIHSGRCPECGIAYLPDDLAIVWSRALRMRALKTA